MSHGVWACCLLLALSTCSCVRFLGAGSADGALADAVPGADTLADAHTDVAGSSEGGVRLDSSGPVLCQGIAGGSYNNTRLSAKGRLELVPGELSGSYTSTLCDASRQVSWQELRLVPGAAYGKPLLASSEAGYPDFNADATELVGLWHLDGPLGALSSNSTIADDSGYGQQGLTHNANGKGLALVAGKLGQALSCDGVDDYVEIASSKQLRGLAQLSVQAWASPGYSGAASQYRRLIAFWQTGDNLGNTFQLSHFPSGYLMFMTSDDMDHLLVAEQPWGQLADLWYHLVGVYDGIKLRLYINGTESPGASRSGALPDRTGPLYFCQGGSASAPPVYEYWGKLDEVAIWRRALSLSEVQALLLRGAARLRLQVRVCDDASCSGKPFSGPDGTAASFYDETTSTSPGPPVFDLAAQSTGRFFQWQATLQRDQDNLNPQLVDVTIAGQ